MTPASGVSLPRNASSVASPRIQGFRRLSLTRAVSRHPSTSSTRSRIPSASFLHFADTPRTPAHPIPATPFPADAKFDLTAFGYSSVFVDVAVSTPITPDIYKPKPMARLPSNRDATAGSPPTTPVTKSTRMFKRLLGNKSKPNKLQTKAQIKGGRDAANTTSDYVSVALKKRSKYAEQPSSGVERKKREVYAAALPPTVKQEAQMRQAMEGGSLEHNIQKVMEEKAKREGTAVKVGSIEGVKVIEGVETVHRDARGGIWWDQEEEWEFAHLLAANKVPLSARCMGSDRWVTFDNLKLKKGDDRDDFTDLSSLPSSKCTDLYHVHPLLVLDDQIEPLVCGRMKSSSVVGSVALPSPSVKSSKIILAIPSRPTRAKHLLQPAFLKDVVAVPPTPSTPSGYSHTSSHPRSPGRVTRFIVRSSSTSGSVRRQRSRSRSVSKRQRKPAPPPLKIVPLGPATKFAVNVELEDDSRRLFLEDSFKPDPITTNSRWSRDTTAAASRPPLVKSDSDDSIDNFALVSIPKKSRGLGGLFKKSERK